MNILVAALVEASKKYVKRNKKHPIVVIDDINRLTPTMLSTLQDAAKDAVDQNTLKFVFVSSSGRAHAQMSARSSWGRRGCVYEVMDPSEQEFVDYLTRRGVELGNAKACYDECGGRLRYVPKTTVPTVEAIRQKQESEVTNQFGLLLANPNLREATVRLSKILLDTPNHSLPTDKARALCGEHSEQIFESSVFAVGINGVRFESVGFARKAREVVREYQPKHSK